MAYTISEGRELIREFARNAGDSTYYPTRMVDFAFRRAANYLIREARLLLRVDAQDTVADTGTYTITPTTFRCDRFVEAFLTGTNVVVQPSADMLRREASFVRGGARGINEAYSSAQLVSVDYAELNDLLIAYPETGQPRLIAFISDTQYALWPTPDQVYTVNRRWCDFFTSWKLGIPTVRFTNTAGVLSAVVVEDGSDHQGTAMTGAFVDTGSGSGATVTANMSNGSLYSATVGTGGSNYSASTIMTLDGNNANDQTFNLADDLLDEVIALGAPAFLQFNDPEHAFATVKGQEFLAFIERLKGKVGGLGVRKIIRR